MTGKISESRLLSGIRDRNNKCFEYLYDHCYPLISRFVFNYGGTVDDVNDLIQDSLVIVYENIVDGKFRGESSVLTYLTTICKNRWLNNVQRNKSRFLRMDIAVHHSNIPEEENTEEELNERMQYAESLLASSTDRCKEILVAYYYENLSMEQIAGRFGYTNADNAKNQKSKCMDKLRRIVKNYAINQL